LPTDTTQGEKEDHRKKKKPMANAMGKNQDTTDYGKGD
jgi:hypothetical protein